MQKTFKIQAKTWQHDFMLPVIKVIDNNHGDKFDFKEQLCPFRESIDWMYFYKLKKLENDVDKDWRLYVLFKWLNKL